MSALIKSGGQSSECARVMGWGWEKWLIENTSKSRSPQSSEWEGRAPYGLVTVVVASSMIKAPDGVRHSDP